MFVSAAALKIVCELALAGAGGLVAMLAFITHTVDRLNVRVAELEARLADRGGRTARLRRLAPRAGPEGAPSDRARGLRADLRPLRRPEIGVPGAKPAAGEHAPDPVTTPPGHARYARSCLGHPAARIDRTPGGSFRMGCVGLSPSLNDHPHPARTP
jgi:hypothetical protein